MNRIVIVALFAIVLLVIDIYVYSFYKAAFVQFGGSVRTISHWVFWTFSTLGIVGLILYFVIPADAISKAVRVALLFFPFANFVSKTILLAFTLFDDVVRAFKWTWNQFQSNAPELPGEKIGRSTFLAQTGIALSAVPPLAIGFGIISGAHDYRVRRKTVYLENLPKAFEGIRMAQISDIHSGSFWNKIAVKGGVEIINKEKPEFVFFTGDLVNNEAKEMQNWVNVFDKVKAPLGVYSSLGNHDYGDYVQWPNLQAKRQNLKDLTRVHKNMGWDLLINENRLLKVDGSELAVLGIENWSAKGRFPKYGKLDVALENLSPEHVKLLLSHDPSHWKAQVLNTDIDMMFAGHTHGMQFGVEIGDVKWSPVQYMYEEWAGLYQQKNQHLYVNRGFGYLGYPGRIGIPPEVTIIELRRKVS